MPGRISELVPGTPPYAPAGLIELSVPNAGAPTGYDTRAGRIQDLLSASPIASTYNGAGVLPQSTSPAGWAITNNFMGFHEVNFWNTVNAADEEQGIYFHQKTGASTSVLMAALYTDGTTYSELDIHSPASTKVFALYLDEASNAAAFGTDASYLSFGGVDGLGFAPPSADSTLGITFGYTADGAVALWNLHEVHATTGASGIVFLQKHPSPTPPSYMAQIYGNSNYTELDMYVGDDVSQGLSFYADTTFAALGPFGSGKPLNLVVNSTETVLKLNTDHSAQFFGPIMQGAVNPNASFQGTASLSSEYNEIAVYGNYPADGESYAALASDPGAGYVYTSHGPMWIQPGNTGASHDIIFLGGSTGTWPTSVRVTHVDDVAGAYEWAYAGDWSKTANVATFGTDQSGGGVARDVSIVRGGTEALRFSSTGINAPSGPYQIGGLNVISYNSGNLDVGSTQLTVRSLPRFFATIGASLGTSIAEYTNDLYGGFTRIGHAATTRPASSGNGGTVFSWNYSGGLAENVLWNPFEGLTGGFSFKEKTATNTHNDLAFLTRNGLLIGNHGAQTPLARLHLHGSASTARSYNLFTDVSNGEWTYMGDWSANVARYGTHQNGTGVARDVVLMRGGQEYLRLDATSVTLYDGSGINLKLPAAGGAPSFLGVSGATYLYGLARGATSGNGLDIEAFSDVGFRVNSFGTPLTGTRKVNISVDGITIGPPPNGVQMELGGSNAALSRARSYNTYASPDASNGEWAYMGDWTKTSDVAVYGTDKIGTGAIREVSFVRGGVEQFRLNAAGIYCTADLIQTPPASITPGNNGDLVVQATSNTSLTFKLKGTDGTVRSGSITLA